MDSKQTIAVIVPTFRREQVLVDTLADLKRQTRKPDEILVVDQTPPGEHLPATAGLLREADGRGELRVVHQDQPHVYAARNLAAQETASDIMLYIDDDVRLPETFVEAHALNYADESIAAVVGAAPHSFDEPRVAPPSDYERWPLIRQAFWMVPPFDRRIQNIGCMHAGNFSVRRRVFLALGGWDEHILTYGDRDFGIRLRRAGHRMDYDPDAGLVHLVSGTGGSRVSDNRAPWRSWQRCVSIHYLAFRYLRGWMFVRYGLWRAARHSILLKRNALRPWRWPAEIAGYLRGMRTARQWAREGLRSPFVRQDGVGKERTT